MKAFDMLTWLDSYQPFQYTDKITSKRRRIATGNSVIPTRTYFQVYNNASSLPIRQDHNMETLGIVVTGMMHTRAEKLEVKKAVDSMISAVDSNIANMHNTMCALIQKESDRTINLIICKESIRLVKKHGFSLNMLYDRFPNAFQEDVDDILKQVNTARSWL
jgi:hypothetical protein